MSLETPRQFTLEDFERAADEYEASETLEDIMEADPHARQKRITTCSLLALRRFHPELQVFAELLVQEQVGEQIVQAVPDNCVALNVRIESNRRSFKAPFEGHGIFWAIEYVSPSSRDRRKDYDECFQKYSEMKVPYVLHFEPFRQSLEMYRHDGVGYEELPRNSRNRFEVPELDLEVGLLEGWVRFWHEGELLPDIEDALDRLNEKDEVLRTKDEELRTKDQAIRTKDEELRTKDEELRTKDEALQMALEGTRERVKRLAARAGRREILAGVANASERQLNLWLDELIG